MNPKVAIIILNWNGLADTLECLESIQKINYSNYVVIVVDNASDDDSVLTIRHQFPSAIVLENLSNLGFAEGCNVGIRYALQTGTDYLFLLNNDTVVEPDVIQECVKVSTRYSGKSILSPKIYYYHDRNRIWFALGREAHDPHTLRSGYDEMDSDQFSRIEEIESACGCAMFFSVQIVNDVGFFDPRYFCYFEEMDWSFRAREKGVKIVFVPDAKVWHKVAASSGGEKNPRTRYYLARNKLFFLKKNHRLNLFQLLIEGIKLFFPNTCSGAGRFILKRFYWDLASIFYETSRAKFWGVYDFCLGRWGASDRQFKMPQKTKPMRVAFITIRFPKLSETFILNQIKGLIDLQHAVRIFSAGFPTESRVHQDVNHYHLREKTSYFVVPSDRSQRLKGFLRAIRYWPKTRHLLGQCFTLNRKKRYDALSLCLKAICFLSEKFDVFYCHYGTLAAELIFLKDLSPKTKFFVSFHGFDLNLPPKDGQDLYQMLFRKADGFITFGAYYEKQLLDFGCPQKKIIRHRLGIDLDFYQKENSQDKNRDSRPIITTIARLEEQKNIEFAVKIIKELQKDFSAQYHLVGNGPLRSQLEKTVEDLNLSSVVKFWGDLPREEILDVLSKTDVFLLTSLWEPFGVVLLEAQAMKIPIVAPQIDGIPEALIDKKTGFLYSPNDLNDAVKKILQLLADPALRETMGEEGRHYVESKFNIRSLSRELQTIFSKMREA